MSQTLRTSTTDAEGLLWWRLREYRQASCAFRRQVAVGSYVADFLCREADLIVELDGEQHAETDQRRHDETRDAWLKTHGYTVIRFWNGDVFTELDSVLDAIDKALRDAGALE
ncbi:MAG: endonuclease domain-containing protein [Litorimonas sp.]